MNPLLSYFPNQFPNLSIYAKFNQSYQRFFPLALTIHFISWLLIKTSLCCIFVKWFSLGTWYTSCSVKKLKIYKYYFQFFWTQSSKRKLSNGRGKYSGKTNDSGRDVSRQAEARRTTEKSFPSSSNGKIWKILLHWGDSPASSWGNDSSAVLLLLLFKQILSKFMNRFLICCYL